MEQEKKQAPNQYNSTDDIRGRLLFAAVVFGGMLFCKFVLGW